MARAIFKVFAWIVDANGTDNDLDGYPKKFDSRSYNGDVDKTQLRAEGELSEVWGAMCKRDDRQMQVAMLVAENGAVLDRKYRGQFAENIQPVEQPIE